MSVRDKWNPEVLRSLGRLDFIAREVLDGVKQGLHRSVRRGFSTEFFDYKSYQDGDDANKIDWRLYAKTRKYFVKRFEAETSLECIMLMDLSKSMTWQWQDTITKKDYCIAMAASIGLLLIEQRDHVGLLTFGEGGNRFLPPRSSMKQLNHLFAILEQKSDEKEELSLLQTVHELRSLQRHRGLIILFSDLEIPVEEVSETLKILSAHGDEVICFHILDDAEVNLPFEGTTHFVDSETNHIFPVNLQYLKNDHEKRVREFRDFFRTESRKNRVIYVPALTSESYVQSIFGIDQARKDKF